jgi:hypothetical protein
MASRGPKALLRRHSRGVTPLARALLPEKGASKIYIAISYSGQNVWLFRKIPRVSMSVGLTPKSVLASTLRYHKSENIHVFFKQIWGLHVVTFHFYAIIWLEKRFCKSEANFRPRFLFIFCFESWIPSICDYLRNSYLLDHSSASCYSSSVALFREGICGVQ